MDEFPSVNVERSLVGLVGDTVLDFGAKHHLVAAHEVVHDIFKRWLEGLWVDQVEVNELVSGDLDPLVSFDKVDEASDFKLVVLLPLLFIRVFFILEYFEE